ncbi:AEC family transporter [Halomonas elongata]|uniref:AEC family transporter n=1 Tax=Halomonas elongata TaxID=2746 RepID=UPI002E29F566|nr:AEC family transporter [Halomonas elongata]WVI71217.1 AEC family transporter [Halomonas elongata]
MLDILAITTPIFLLIGFGYLTVAGRIISREQLQGVGIFVMYCALPALIIRALTQNALAEVFNPHYLLAYGVGSLAVFGLGLAISLKVRRHPLGTSAILSLGMSASNSGFIGYPVASMVLGPPAAIFLALCMVIENLLIIPLALILAELGHQTGNDLRKTLRRTFLNLTRNPVLIGLLIGVLLASINIPLPQPFTKAIDMLASAAGPAALFVIGGTLHGLRVNGMAQDLGQLAIGKLVLHPLAVFGMFLLLPDLDPTLLTGALLFASAPMISVYPLFGQRYGLDGVTTAALMVCTLSYFVTISLVLWLMRHSGLFALSSG